MAENIKAKIELVTKSSVGAGQSSITGGNKSFQRSLSMEKFKAAKSITSGTLGKIIVGGFIAAVSSLINISDEGDSGVADAGGSFQSNQQIENMPEVLTEYEERAKELGGGLLQLNDGSVVVVDEQNRWLEVLKDGKTSKAVKLANFVMEVDKAIPQVPKFVKDLTDSVWSVVAKVKGAIGSFFTPSISTPSISTPSVSTPSNANFNHIKYGAVYVPPPISGGNYPIIDLDMLNPILNYDLINSGGQD